MTGFCDSMASQVQTSTDESVASVREARDVIEETTSSNGQLFQAMTEVLDQMRNMLSTAMTHNTKVEQLIPVLKDKETKLQTEKADSLSQIEQFKAKMSGMKDSVQEKLGACVSAVKLIDTNVSKSMELNRSKDERLVESVKTAHEEFKNQTNVVGNQLDAMVQEIGNINDLADVNISAGLNDLVNECGNAQARIDADLSHFATMNANIEALQNDFQQNLAKDVDFCEKRLNSFRTTDIAVYKPSGETPAKSTYTYPRKLVATSPHAKILNDFWQNHDGNQLECSAIVNEEEEEGERSGEDLSGTCVGDSTIVNDATSRTLAEIYNMNAVSTPFVENDQRKVLSMMQMSLNNNISQIRVRNSFSTFVFE